MYEHVVFGGGVGGGCTWNYAGFLCMGQCTPPSQTSIMRLPVQTPVCQCDPVSHSQGLHWFPLTAWLQFSPDRPFHLNYIQA